MSKEFRNEFLKSLNSLAPRIKRVLRFEGTEIASTGETGGTKFLREDGDGTCSWQDSSGGAVSAVANGADNRVATFSSSDALNGEANLTFDGTDLGVSAKIFHVGDTDTYINFTDDDINIQAGGVNFLDFTQDTQSDVTFNEGGVDIDFRVETADESHMLFIEGSSNRMSIGDNTGSPGATLEVKNHASAGASGVPLVQLNSNDTDEIALDINADNIDANVVDILANAVTTANVMNVSADGLTTGGILNLVSNSSDTNARSLVTIKNDNTAATATTLLHLINDSTSASADMIIESTDADAAAAPKIHFLRNSASPADDDVLGKVLFSGKDDAGNTTLYASIRAEINDQTDSGGQEDGVIVFDIIKNNSQKSALELKNNEAVFNNSSADIDFRVESDDNTHMLFVDGNDNTVAAGGIDATNHKDGFAVFNDFNVTTFENTLADGHFGSAEILRYSPGANETLTSGQLYFLHTDGTWNQTDADAVATGATQLIGIGLGSAREAGVLLKGFIRIPSSEILNLPGSGACDGLPIYVSTTAGHLDFTAPTGTGDFVRVVGYAIDDDSSDVLVYINPSATHVELA